ncbi:MAG: Holliday junction resolvase RuvX [Lysobacterales bacterium]
MPEPRPLLVLGFDYGSRRIGVAVGQRVTETAQALTVIDNGPGGPDWHALDKVLRDWQPQLLVVGLPLQMDGGEQSISIMARDFADRLRERTALPVYTQDERLSSRQVAREFANARRRGEARRKHGKLLDAHAARVIIERFFADTETNPPAPTDSQHRR